MRVGTSPAHPPSTHTLSGAVSSRAALAALCRGQSILGTCPHLSSQRCPLPSRSLQAPGHLQQPCLRRSHGQSGWPCVPRRGCGLSRHKPRGWGPRGSSQCGSTASSAGGERGGGQGRGQGQCPHPWAPKQGAASLDHVKGMRLNGSVSLPTGRQRSCCRISPWAASWSASARALSALSSPTGEGTQPNAREGPTSLIPSWPLCPCHAKPSHPSPIPLIPSYPISQIS